QAKYTLVRVLDAPLHRSPVDALLDRQSHYIVQAPTSVYLPSAASFALLRRAAQPKESARTILAVGGIPYDHSNLTQSAVTRGYSETALLNLPGSREEALASAATFPIRFAIEIALSKQA